jgi:hypothetical protein
MRRSHGIFHHGYQIGSTCQVNFVAHLALKAASVCAALYCGDKSPVNVGLYTPLNGVNSAQSPTWNDDHGGGCLGQRQCEKSRSKTMLAK